MKKDKVKNLVLLHLVISIIMIVTFVFYKNIGMVIVWIIIVCIDVTSLINLNKKKIDFICKKNIFYIK